MFKWLLIYPHCSMQLIRNLAELCFPLVAHLRSYTLDNNSWLHLNSAPRPVIVSPPRPTTTLLSGHRGAFTEAL